jgi:dolichol-phosphate mannosyltransferase
LTFAAAEAACPHRKPASAHPSPLLAIVVPTFNERENIARLIEQLDRALAGIAWEAIFVDDRSPDGTISTVRDCGRRDPRVRGILRIGRRGLAGACIEGLLASNAPYLAVMDADLQHDAGLLPRMVVALDNGSADLVIGSRYVAGGSVDGFASGRRLASKLSTVMARRMTAVAVADPMSGFFMIRQDAFQRLAPGLASEGFKILFDILATAHGQLRVVEMPFTFGARTAGSSKLDVQNAFDFLGLLVSKLSRGFIPLRFVSFMAVGLIGVFVHLAALRIGLLSGASFAPAQVAATLIAMTSNFVLNNAITYRDLRLRGSAALKGLVIFYVICGTGALSNVGVATWLYANEPVWWMAGLAGSIIGAVWNYMVSSQVLWRR